MDPFQVLLASEDFKDFRNSSPSLLEQSRVVRAGHLRLTARLQFCVGLGQPLKHSWPTSGVAFTLGNCGSEVWHSASPVPHGVGWNLMGCTSCCQGVGRGSEKVRRKQSIQLVALTGPSSSDFLL